MCGVGWGKPLGMPAGSCSPERQRKERGEEAPRFLGRWRWQGTPPDRVAAGAVPPTFPQPDRRELPVSVLGTRHLRSHTTSFIHLG